MHQISENNWVTWRHNQGPLCGRSSSPQDSFEIIYNPAKTVVGGIMEEACKASRSIVETYPDLKPSIFFSGGIDSEIMLRSFIEIGVEFDLFVVRYEDDLNIHDVSHAFVISSLLGCKLNVLDFNIKDFFENDADTAMEEAQCDRPRMLPQLMFGHMVDGLPILAGGDMTWQRTNDDYSKKGTWEAIEFEHDIAWDRYYLYHNRPAVYSWQRWTPGNLVAHMKTSWFQRLINDGYHGKIANTSTKMDCFQKELPNAIHRKKHHGLEQCEDLIINFEKHILEKHRCFPYRREERTTPEDLWFKVTRGTYKRYDVRNLF